MQTKPARFPTRPTDDERAELSLPPLPPLVADVLHAERAPPRLAAHLMLVHDVALQLLVRVQRSWPALVVDADAVAFGAASHDIGKARYPDELSVPGVLHEAAGRALLLEHGAAPPLARFAETHGSQTTDLPLEDLLVIAADTVWKAKRSKAIDDALVRAVATATAAAPWEIFMTLDSVFTALAKNADRRLAWQARFSVTPERE